MLNYLISLNANKTGMMQSIPQKCSEGEKSTKEQNDIKVRLSMVRGSKRVVSGSGRYAKYVETWMEDRLLDNLFSFLFFAT